MQLLTRTKSANSKHMESRWHRDAGKQTDHRERDGKRGARERKTTESARAIHTKKTGDREKEIERDGDRVCSLVQHWFVTVNEDEAPVRLPWLPHPVIGQLVL